MDIKLIASIIGLSIVGIDPTSFFKKDQITMLTNKMKDKYELSKDTIGFLIKSINDHNIPFIEKVLATKLLWNMRPNKCTAGTIVEVELCGEGVQMNWSHYLLNELLEDAEESQGKGNALHYS